ncbi:MAG: hypothetical protein N2110_02155 [Flavobacteriales bacterium]|nr:hypothetical protein [Flavobacteriales bacterium]MCX7767812.1 hypothetical protein [Flavobacteriales bacterium]MDW8409787.1 hypothetical protein [Flavobacteriales bacterium]
MDTSFWIDVIGWVGGGLVLLAYMLISTGRVDNSTAGYHLLNMFGSIFLIINTAYLSAFPSMMVNVIWTGVAIMGLLRRNSSKSSAHH